MDTAAPKFFLFLLSIPIICCSPVKDIEDQELQQTKEQIFHSSRRQLGTTPLKLTVPTDTSAIPPTNPVSVTPTPVTGTPTTPTTDPTSPPMPVTNPVTTPGANNPGGQPGTDPVTSPSPTTGGFPVTTPAVAPPVANNAPATQGQSWCVAKNGASETSLQTALDYACGIEGADCSAIQEGARCYNPNTLQNHASYAFNSYYQKNPAQTSCDFGGVAAMTNVNPSSGSCIFPTSSSSTSPTTTTPTTSSPPGATPTNSGTPPTVSNSSNPETGTSPAGFGDSPPIASTDSVSLSTCLQPFIGSFIAVMSIISGKIILDI